MRTPSSTCSVVSTPICTSWRALRGSCFLNFSSAFSTFSSTLLDDKMTEMQPLAASLMSWIVDYPTRRPQNVHLQYFTSDKVISNTEAPRRTILSSLLFTLFSHYTETCHVPSFLMTLQWLAASVRVIRQSTGLWWTACLRCNEWLIELLLPFYLLRALVSLELKLVSSDIRHQ